VPKNIFKALADGDMLGIILFSLLFGFFLNQLDHETSSPVKSILTGCFETVLKMTHWIMKALSPAVFFLVLDASSKLDLSTLTSLATLVVILLAGYAAHIFLFWGFILKFLANISLQKHMRAVSPALFTAFSTSSSAATFPVTLESLEKNVGISNKSCSFILPLGSSINMAGTAMYACVGALFLAKLYGIPLPINTQLTVVFLSFFSSFAIAGVPSACLIALLIVLETIGIPSEAISIVIGLERLIDMIRTTVNVYGNTACVSLVAAWQKESLKTQIKD
jgi:Na+/H+-dicarboxylate symporter